MSIGSLNQDHDQAPGFCSSSSMRPLTSKDINRIVKACKGSSAVGGVSVFSEKELVGSGTRKLCVLQKDDEFTFVEYAGVRKAKFVSKDADRFEAMVKGARTELGDQVDVEPTKVVLLASNGTICRRNTLARLHRNGIIVMRRSVGNDDDDSSSE